jgi:hypothetical protein
MANETASTGVAELDRALDGVYRGDNVVPGQPVLRRGERLPAIRRGIDGWGNAGGSDAQCLWVLRD